jgi:hypothetical protein
MTAGMMENVMMSNPLRNVRDTTIHLAVIAATMLFAAQGAQAQTVNYTATVPIVKTIPHPCRAGFELINGTMNVAITAIQSTDFKLQIKFTSTGRGDDADATGLLLPTGLPYYEYSSDVTADASFPDGKPAYFSHTLTISDYLARIDSTTDFFIMTTVFNVAYNYGIPTTPTLQSIDISCQ